MLILILSFRAFAGFLTPDFDSDQAVHVLMAFDLRLPEDLYYWGQSRLGSLLPIVSHWLLSVSSLTPIEAVSYAQYGFLLVGFLCFVSLFKKSVSKLTFALVWFLPPAPFMKLVEVAHPYAPQLALFGIALVCTNTLATTAEAQRIKKLLLSLGILSSLALSMWVSDLSIVPVLLAGVTFIHSFLKRDRKERSNSAFYWFYGSLFAVLIFWIIFLAYAKLNAAGDANYGVLAINGIENITQIVQSIVTAVSGTFLFQKGHPFLSLYAIAAFSLIILLTRYYLQIRQEHQLTFNMRWIPFLGISSIGTFIVILLSRWTYIQEAPPRYFIVIYIFCWVSALLVFENLDRIPLIRKVTLRRIGALLVLTALLGSLSLPSYVFAFNKPQSRLSMLQPLATLGEVGFIGDYWASYLLCIVAPDRLSCTPHEQDFARCSRCVEKVFKAPVIYLVDRDWLDSFPDEIEQFGRRLEKQEPAQEIAGYWMAPYRNITRPRD